MKKRPRILALILFTILIISILSGCSKSNENRNNTDTEKGETKIFTFGDFRLEVTNTHNIRTEKMIDDGGTPWEYYILTYYPGADIKVLSADMNDGSLTDDGEPYAQWGIELATDERIRIVDDMEPIALTQDIIGIYNLESSLYVIKFEMTQE